MKHSKAHLLPLVLLGLCAFIPALRADTVVLSSIYGTSNSATITNFSLAGNSFTFTLNNTSPSGSITGIGFALPGTRPDTYSLSNSTDSDFSLAMNVAPGGGAEFLVDEFDFALLTGSTFGSGSISGGIGSGGSATFTVTGDFSGLTASNVAGNVFARLESASFTDTLSSTGAVIPEPSTTALLVGAGVLGGLRALRRKRSA